VPVDPKSPPFALTCAPPRSRRSARNERFGARAIGRQRQSTIAHSVGRNFVPQHIANIAMKGVVRHLAQD
jgi:hypothetical protein